MPPEVLEMHKLEQEARDAWAELGVAAREFVAIGFEDPFDETITWFELPNVAGAGEFLVEPEPVIAALRAARDSLDTACARYLWHSHYIAVEPSAADVSNFPDWVDAGMVFHAPSGTTTLYNAAGIIGQEPILISARDTEVEATHG